MLSSDQGENWSHGLRYHYADNFGVVGSTETNATEMYSVIAKPMIRVGLQVHDEVRTTCDAETLGVRLRFDTGVATVPTERRWRLHSGCREFAQRKRTCGRRLEKIMGHQTLASLMALHDLVCLEGVCERSWRLLALWCRVSRQVSVSRGQTFVTARMPPSLEALSRCDLRLHTKHLYIGRLRGKRRFKCQQEAVRPCEHALSIRETVHPVGASSARDAFGFRDRQRVF